MGQIKIKPGEKFGKLTVIERAENHITSGGNSLVQWKCKCDCGNIVTRMGSSLKKAVACGKCRGENLSGQRIGRLLVLGISDKKDGGRRLWKCRCDCGKTVNASISSLKGQKVSCGCWQAELRKNVANTVCETIQSDSHRKKQTAITIKKYRDGWKSPANTSGYTGVSFSKSNGKFQAYITVEKKKYNLGYYYTAEEAAEIRKVAENKIYGDFLSWYSENYPEQWGKICKRHKNKNEGYVAPYEEG